jgi:hypothetical protein
MTLNTNSIGAFIRHAAAIGAGVLAVLPTSTTGEPTWVRVGLAGFTAVIEGVEHYLQPKPTTTPKASV